MAISLLNVFSYAIVVLIIAASTHLLLRRNRQAAVLMKATVAQEEMTAAGGLIPYLRRLHNDQLTVKASLPMMPKTVSTLDPAVMKATLNIADRPTDLFRFLDPIIGKDNLQSFPPDQALRLRKLIGAAFTPDAVEFKYHSLLDIALEFVKGWERQAEEKGRENVILMQREGLSLSVRFAVKTLLRLDAGDVDMKRFQERYDKVLNGLYDRQFGLLTPEREVELERNLHYINEFMAGSVRSHIEARRDGTGKQEKARDLLQIMLDESDPETEEPFTDNMIEKMMSAFLIGAYHTTGVSIAWALCFIAQEPTVQARLHDEVDKVLQGRSPTTQDLVRMEYLGQVIKESLRINPPGAFAARLVPKSLVTRALTNDMVIIEAGSTLMVPLCVLHEQHFMNPEEFDPDRFAPNAESVPRFTYAPFGYGARICPGERLALMELKMMICLVMQKFHIELACNKDEIVKTERFVVMATNDMPLRMTKRKVVAV